MSDTLVGHHWLSQSFVPPSMGSRPGQGQSSGYWHSFWCWPSFCTSLLSAQSLLSRPTGYCGLCFKRVWQWHCCCRLSLLFSSVLQCGSSTASLSPWCKLSHTHKGRGIQFPSSLSSKELARILSPSDGSTSSFVKNSTQLVARASELKLDRNNHQVSYDVHEEPLHPGSCWGCSHYQQRETGA